MLYRRLKYSLAFIGICLFLSVQALGQSIIFVNQAATGLENGSSWKEAFASLQDAIVSARPGDEIWVAAGIYKPDQGAEIATGDVSASFVLDKTIYIYGGFTGTEHGRDQRDYEMNRTVLSGDLLDNDLPGPDFWDSPTRDDNAAHVIQVMASTDNPAPILDGLSIIGGHSNPSSGGHGGGILILDENAHIRLENLVFEFNFAEYCGGAILNIGSFSITDSRFFQNRAGGLLNRGCAGGSGGAIFSTIATIFSTIPNEPRIESTVFESNTGIRCGGALTTLYRSIVVVKSVFVNNFTYDMGAATCDRYYRENESIYANTQYLGNTTRLRAAAILVDDTPVRVYNSVFSANTAPLQALAAWGGAIGVVDNRGHLEIMNSNFVNNSAHRGGAIWSQGGATLNVSNSVFWDNTTTEGRALAHTDDAEHIISTSIVQGGVPSNYTDGGGNLNADPMFFDPDGQDNIPGTSDDDFHLAFNSPNIDSGKNESLPTDVLDLDQDGRTWEQLPVDIEMRQRIFDGGSGGAIVDMGAFEYGAPPIVLATDHVVEVRPEQVLLNGNYPNPFNPSTTITYSLPRPSEVRLEVFDLLGKRVRLLESGFNSTGEHEVTFDASGLGSGIYFYTLITGDFTRTRKMVVVK